MNNILEKMEKNTIKVVSIDTENMTYACDDGNEYPLMDGLENMSVEELQMHIDNAHKTTIDILKNIEENDG